MLAMDSLSMLVIIMFTVGFQSALVTNLEVRNTTHPHTYNKQA